MIPVANLPGCNPSKWGQRLQFLPPLCVILITAITLALPQSQAKTQFKQQAEASYLFRTFPHWPTERRLQTSRCQAWTETFTS